jgi:hypothetical protein
MLGLLDLRDQRAAVLISALYDIADAYGAVVVDSEGVVVACCGSVSAEALALARSARSQAASQAVECKTKDGCLAVAARLSGDSVLIGEFGEGTPRSLGHTAVMAAAAASRGPFETEK